ncbi:hypothetical protein ACQKC5_01380 [Shewanella baltica]|uniref:hypothetical protein n=1 Tax=Shewanella baltica TaxID=62322 RepID=UPI003D0788DB
MAKFNLDDFFEDDIPTGWKCALISNHSHSLSQSEAEMHWMTFTSLSGESDPNWAEFVQAENSFKELFSNLECDIGLYICEQNINGHSPKLASNSISDAISYNVREKRFDAFTSDQFDCVILGNFDLTFPVFISEEQEWGTIENAVLKSGLHLLK